MNGVYAFIVYTPERNERYVTWIMN